MEKEIPWNTGNGNITVSYKGIGSDSVSIRSDPNEGIDRTREINVETGDGGISCHISVSQPGRREEVELAGGSVLDVTEGGFWVLKKYIDINN